MHEEYLKIISLLVEWRKKRSLTQAELAEKLGKPQSYVAKYELCSRNLDVVEFMEVCKVLGLRPSKMMVLAQ